MKYTTTLSLMILTVFVFGQQTINSVMNGNASNPFIWDCTCIPATSDNINIYHNVIMDVNWLVNGGGSITVHQSGTFVESTGGIGILFDGNSSELSNHGTFQITNLAFTTGAIGHNHANMVLDTALYVSINSTFMNHGLLNGIDSIYNQGTFMNEGTIFNGDFLNEGTTMNTGYLVSDSLYNLGTINLSAGNITAFDCGNGGTINITGGGSLFVDNDFLNIGDIFIAAGRDVMVGRDFASGNLSTFDALVDNHGIFHVMRDFTNSDTLKGSGVFCLGESTTNFGFVKETLDICDNTPTGTHFDANLGTIEPGVTSCQSGCVVNVDENNMATIKVYPNPVSDIMYINVSELTKGSVLVFDISGRLIHESNFSNSDEVSVNTLSWDKGVYMVRVIADNQQIVETKVIR